MLCKGGFVSGLRAAKNDLHPKSWTQQTTIEVQIFYG